uniref:Si:dkey-103g5.3 n=1 Tax=Gadus morhua TaxID=8049 RepID=A0A8C4ZBX7_GADMO
MLLHLCLPLVVVFIQPTLSTYNCSSEYDRVPDNTDMMVDCGTSMITLEVNLCSAQWAGFNATGLALNGEHGIPDCQGTIHTDVVPPVIRYQLPVNHTQANPCRQSLQIVDEAPDPSGHFGDFLTVQSLIITGFVDTPGSSEGLISYATDLYYHFSCRYPLEYLLNNTQIIDLHSGLVVCFILYVCFKDTNYNHQLLVPISGLELRTKIYVEVEAVNMTGKYVVHTWETANAACDDHRLPLMLPSCSVNQKAALTINGVAKNSRFNFEAFRFVEHRDQEKSSIYLHCMLRLLHNNFTVRCKQPVILLWMIVCLLDNSISVTAVVLGALFGSAAVTLVILASWMAVKKFYYSGAGLSAFN